LHLSIELYTPDIQDCFQRDGIRIIACMHYTAVRLRGGHCQVGVLLDEHGVDFIFRELSRDGAPGDAAADDDYVCLLEYVHFSTSYSL